MKIIVTGASGTAGTALTRAAVERGHSVIALGNKQPLTQPGLAESYAVDLYDHESLTSLILEHFPDAVVNAAAMSDPEAIAADSTSAEILNVALPRRLAQICHHLSSRFIHLSCMSVFDGGDAPYRSTDMPAPTDIEGQLKLMAERDVLKFGGNSTVVLRVPLLLGNSLAGDRSFHEKLLHTLAAGQPVLASERRIVQPCATENLGDLVIELCERPNLHGIFHWAGASAISELELAQRILHHFNLDPAGVTNSNDAPSSDLSSDLRPLLGKVRTQPTSVESQIAGLQLPGDLADWHSQHASASIPPRRLRRGIDF